MSQGPAIGRPPRRYDCVLVGRGRLARHLKHYFEHLRMQVWYEFDARFPHGKAGENISSPLLCLAVSDGALAELSEQFAELYPEARLMHFSGTTSVAGVSSWHPLASFGTEVFAEWDRYRSIPFVGCPDSVDLSLLLPKLPNAWTRIETSQRAEYHALCVLAGNGMALLAQHFVERMSKLTRLQNQDLFSYLLASLQNVVESGRAGMSGPWGRKDELTISKNLEALSTEESEIYRALRNLFEANFQNRKQALSENQRL